VAPFRLGHGVYNVAKYWHIRSPRCVITQRRALCFAAVSFLFSFFFFYSARDLRGLSADRRETLPHDRQWVQFWKLGPKIRVLPPKIGSRKTCFFRAISDDFAVPSRISCKTTQEQRYWLSVAYLQYELHRRSFVVRCLFNFLLINMHVYFHCLHSNVHFQFQSCAFVTW